jgi:hypothetical protein
MMNLLLTEGAQWFTGVAVVASLLFGVTVLLLFVGGDGGLDSGGDIDLPDGGGDGNSAFKVLSLQGVVGFGMGWGWGGLVAFRSLGWGWSASAIAGVVVGGLFVGLLWLGFKLVYSLAGDGNVYRRDAVGLVGTVTVAIPASGSGRVRVVIRNHQREFSATSRGERIELHSTVRVVAVRDDGMLGVEPV